jgi:hypothetical protein
MKPIYILFVICCWLNVSIQAQETIVVGTVLNTDQIKGEYIYYIFHRFIDDSINYVYKQRID